MHPLERAALKMQIAYSGDQPGPLPEPDVDYIQYLLEDSYRPSDLPEDLIAVAYDKELALTNLTDKEIHWIRLQLLRGEIAFRMSRPPGRGGWEQEIKLTCLPAKQFLKLTRSRGGFERKQQTTQTLIRQAITYTGEEKRGFTIFGRRKEVPT